MLLSITCLSRVQLHSAQNLPLWPVFAVLTCGQFSLSIPFINTAAAPEEQVSTLYQPLLGNLTSTAEHSYTESFDTCLKTCLWKATKILKHHPDYSSHSTVSLKSAPGNLFNTLSNFSSSQQPISKLSEDPLLFYIYQKTAATIFIARASNKAANCHPMQLGSVKGCLAA